MMRTLLCMVEHTGQVSTGGSRKAWVQGETCNGNHAISVHADHMVPGGTGGVLGIRISGQGPDSTPS